MQRGFLVLDDGTLYTGWTFGGVAQTPLRETNEQTNLSHRSIPKGFCVGMGELVFNTGMTGYQEIITDPSYSGQLVLMTSPHIGNYGVDKEWAESNPATGALGLICREYYTGTLPEGRESLDSYMKELGIPGIHGIDTRSLTLHLREKGSQNGLICQMEGDIPTEKEVQEALQILATCPSMEGCSLIDEVGVTTMVERSESEAPRIAVVDCGIKENIVREFISRGANPILFPSTVTWKDIQEANVVGVFLSNGPGDPGVLTDLVDLAKQAIASGVPLTGICLGHQIIAQALGAKTFKMKFGHHGCNHPVRDESTGKVFVTSQNHGFAVAPETLPQGVDVWFTNANDNSIEGIKDSSRPVCSVQFHPEAAPGPHDASWIFDTFLHCMKGEA